MDGTLTVPCLDFPAMRRAAGVPEGGDLLAHIESLSGEARRVAIAAVEEEEDRALARLRLAAGAGDVCTFLDDRGVPRALLTRNRQAAVSAFHAALPAVPAFSPALSREFQPYKPDPAPLVHIAERWGVPSTELIMVGDSAPDDVACGRRAGALTIWLDERGPPAAEELSGDSVPHYTARDLHEVREIIRHLLDC